MEVCAENAAEPDTGHTAKTEPQKSTLPGKSGRKACAMKNRRLSLPALVNSVQPKETVLYR